MNLTQMKGTQDVRKVITEEVNALRTGKSIPARGNAIANLIGKLIQTVKLDIEVHRYVSSDKRQVKYLNTELLDSEKTTKKLK